MLHAFSNEYLKNNALTRTIININNIYTHGGLDKLTDDEIKKLQNIVDYYLHDDLEYTNKD